MNRYWIGLSAAACFVLGGANLAEALPLVATFDQISEGKTFASFTDDGITFSNLNRYGLEGDFVIESGTSAENGAFFSPPNYLSTGGFIPGLGESFGRFGSADITFGDDATFASLDLFTSSGFDNVLTLNASLDGTLVASDTITLPLTGTGVSHQTLSISGVTFDHLQLVSSGPANDGASFIGIDNVAIDTLTSVPEPATLLLLGSGLAGFLLVRNRVRRGAA